MKLKNKSILLLFILGVSLCSGFISFANACQTEEPELNYAEWRFSNNQPYLHVEADNYYTLGFLQGQNLAFQTAWMKLMIMLQAQQIGLSYDIAIYYALDYLEFIPEQYLLEMQGIADAIDVVLVPFMGEIYEISIDFMDVLVQNCFWDIYYGKIIPMLTGYPQAPLIAGACTAIGSHTSKKTVFGQTIDLTLLMMPTVSAVYTKINSKKIFSFRMGSMLAFGGVNKWGLSVSVNLIEVFNYGCSGKPLSIIYRTVLEKARTIRQARYLITSNDFTLGWNYIIRTKRNLAAIETIPNSYSFERINRGGYTFDANIYENSLFRMFMIYPTFYVQRYNRVLELCQTYNQDGDLDINDMFSIYSDSLISRRFTTGDPMEVATVGSFFIDHKNNIYFCIGNPLDSSLGVIPSFKQ
ncbi:MAG: carcinine hydrolase/isopenicillin-N N-acyltransferase family protein [Candidatus Hermodarchaeota archaeon]